MGYRPRLAGILLFLITLPLAGGGWAKELWEQPWIEVKSPHFRFVSGIGEQRTREMAQELEYFRTVVQRITNIKRFDERIPTTVFLLPEKAPELGIRGDVAGYLRPLMRENLLVVSPAGAYLDETVKHEYVHFLVHNRDDLLYPPWLDEGFAEVLSALEATPTTYAYGRILPARASWLEYEFWTPFEEILTTRHTSEIDRDRVQMFYAQSWLLVHYLMIGRKEGSFPTDAGKFLALSNSGMRPEAAFEQAFGIPVKKLRGVLQKYAKRVPLYKASLKESLKPAELSVQALPKDEIAARLGWIAIHRGFFEPAALYMQASLGLNPRNTRALVGQGDLLKFAGKFIEAEPFYIQAIDLEPEDPYHELDYAEYLMDRATAFQRLGDEAAAEASFQEARKHFNKSIALNPKIPETQAMYGLSYMLEGVNPDRAVASLEAAHDLLPSHAEIRLALAKAYLENGQAARARADLQKLLAWSHTDGVEQITKLLAEAEAAVASSAPAEASTR